MYTHYIYREREMCIHIYMYMYIYYLFIHVCILLLTGSEVSGILALGLLYRAWLPLYKEGGMGGKRDFRSCSGEPSQREAPYMGGKRERAEDGGSEREGGRARKAEEEREVCCRCPNPHG